MAVGVRAQRSYGRPGTTVFPPDWSTSHAPVAAGWFTGTVSLREPGGTDSAFDPETGVTTVTPFEPFAADLASSITPLGADGETGPATETAGDMVRITGYLVQVDLTFDGDDAPALKPGCLIDVVTCDDALLVGRTLTVNDIARGSRRFTRDLVATLND